MQDHMLDLYSWGRGWPKTADGKGPDILELGVRTGNSTSAFLAAVESDQRGHVWSIDVREPDVPQEWAESPWWDFLWADDLSPGALSWAPPRVNVLFIDTSHQYEHTLAELRTWVPRVVSGGVVLLHDTEYACRDSKHTRDWEPHASDVGRALDAYCAETGLEWRNKHGCFGLGTMRIR